MIASQFDEAASTDERDMHKLINSSHQEHGIQKIPATLLCIQFPRKEKLEGCILNGLCQEILLRKIVARIPHF